MFLSLLYVAKGSSILNFREKRTILNRISNHARVNLTHTLGALTSHSQATICLSFRFMDRTTLLGYSEPDPLCSRGLLQHIKYNFLSLQDSGVKSTCWSDRLLGLPRTIFTACGQYFQTLNHHYHTLRPYQVHQHRRTSTNPPMILIVIAESKQSTLISLRVTGYHSTFTDLISIATIRDSDLVFNQQVSRIMHLRFSINFNNLNAQLNNNDKLHNLK